MTTTILKGTIVSAAAAGAPEITEGGYLVAENGVITGVFPTLPDRYTGAPVEDFGSCLILQTFADLHLHAPQYPMLGTGMDLTLLDWLNTYTFPAEARFADPGYARDVYRKLAAELTAHGTTRVAMFSSLHTDATLILMEELERAGVTGYVGKVNMDRNAAPGVLEETTEESIRETERWLAECGRFSHVRPMLTPRFTPSCTDELMAWLGKTARERGLPIQSHLSENDREIQWVRQLHPDCTQYWETYAKFGLHAEVRRDNPMVAVAHAKAESIALMAVFLYVLKETDSSPDAPYIIMCIEGVNAEKVAVESVTSPETELGLHEDVLPFHVRVVECPRVVRNTESQRGFLADTHLRLYVERRCGPTEHVSLESHYLRSTHSYTA